MAQIISLLNEKFTKDCPDVSDSVSQTNRSTQESASTILPSSKPMINPKYADNSELSDIRFKIDDKIIYAHRIVLVNASDGFKRLLDNPSGIIELDNVSYDVFKVLIDHMYGNRSQSHERMVAEGLIFQLEAMEASLTFGLDHFTQECYDLIKSEMNDETCVRIYRFAQVRRYNELTFNAISFSVVVSNHLQMTANCTFSRISDPWSRMISSESCFNDQDNQDGAIFVLLSRTDLQKLSNPSQLGKIQSGIVDYSIYTYIIKHLQIVTNEGIKLFTVVVFVILVVVVFVIMVFMTFLIKFLGSLESISDTSANVMMTISTIIMVTVVTVKGNFVKFSVSVKIVSWTSMIVTTLPQLLSFCSILRLVFFFIRFLGRRIFFLIPSCFMGRFGFAALSFSPIVIVSLSN